MLTKPFTILMADDDDEDLELIEMAILTADPGTILHKVTNGKQALSYLDNKKENELPGLIILDYNMPELTGAELSVINKQERYETIPKIILSTSSAPLHIHECMSHGATDYLVKPDNLKELDELAKKMLAFSKMI